MHYGGLVHFTILSTMSYASQTTLRSIQRLPVGCLTNILYLPQQLKRTNPSHTSSTQGRKSLEGALVLWPPVLSVLFYTSMEHMFSRRDPESHHNAEDTRGTTHECLDTSILFLFYLSMKA